MVLGESFHRSSLALLCPGYWFGKPAIQPRVSEGLAGGEARRRVPVQTLLYEVSKGGVLAALECSTPILATWRASHLATARAGPRQHSGSGGQSVCTAVPRVALGVDEVFCSFGLLQDLLRWHPQQLHDTGQLVALIFAGEQGVASQQLGQNATKAPHVNRKAVT